MGKLINLDEIDLLSKIESERKIIKKITYLHRLNKLKPKFDEDTCINRCTAIELWIIKAGKLDDYEYNRLEGSTSI